MIKFIVIANFITFRLDFSHLTIALFVLDFANYSKFTLMDPFTVSIKIVTVQVVWWDRHLDFALI